MVQQKRRTGAMAQKMEMDNNLILAPRNLVLADLSIYQTIRSSHHSITASISSIGFNLWCISACCGMYTALVLALSTLSHALIPRSVARPERPHITKHLLEFTKCSLVLAQMISTKPARFQLYVSSIRDT